MRLVSSHGSGVKFRKNQSHNTPQRSLMPQRGSVDVWSKKMPLPLLVKELKAAGVIEVENHEEKVIFLRFPSDSGRQCVYEMMTDEMKKYAHLAVASTLQASLFKAGGRRGSVASIQMRSRKIPECEVSPSETNRIWSKVAQHFEAA